MPMLVTLSGIVIEAKEEQSLKALLPMPVTVFGIFVDLQPAISILSLFLMMALQLFRESKNVLVEATTIEVRDAQELKGHPF